MLRADLAYEDPDDGQNDAADELGVCVSCGLDTCRCDEMYDAMRDRERGL